MPALARGQASDCANPVLDLFTSVSGVLTDVAVLEFQVFEKVTDPANPVQVYPATPGARQAVDVANLCPTGDKLGTGHYVARWTPPLTEPIGTHEIRWFFKLTASSPEQTFREEFEVLPEVTGSTAAGYCTVQDLRDEGVPTSGPFGRTDAELQRLIALASRMVDRFTGRFFEPRSKTYTLDGRGTRTLFLGQPIIEVSRVELDGVEVPLSELVVYNRHLTEELLDPDDRDNPKIERLVPEAFGRRALLADPVWPRGQRNVKVFGVFGYTDPDGTPYGKTPDMIRHATKLLVLRELPRMFDQMDDRDDFRRRHMIRSLKTRDQSISYAVGGGRTGVGFGPLGGSAPFTGDPEIDGILLHFRRPARIGAA